MADKNIAWYDWVRLKEEKARKKKAKQSQISWNLPEGLMPVTIKWYKIGYRRHAKSWCVKGSETPDNFIYLLIENDTKEVRYVGNTDEPHRRFAQHQRNYRLGTKKFTMSVVDVGHTVTEQKWINDLTQKGHRLLNLVSACRANELA